MMARKALRTYAKARRDFEYLEGLADYTDQVELDAERLDLMQEPTKDRAACMYESGIGGWFREHGDSFDDDARVRRIRADYYL